ncbi:hypothetical protein SCLCIDRAFT_29020 [Scleroderma citrinum Foug A]|uniref:Uncharacterized protein n=1 Tax=Scleroderma citrinum Foug A TaxID=1036808 RepID=A0A0C3DMB8_9AGAM|nr:hypothetical protein SCLCIDRAFT_29020 [Scleroderma citrinum Foug A]
MTASVTATQSINYRSSSLNLSPKFKWSVKRAIQCRMRRYNQSLDPSVCKEVELSVLDAVDLAVRIIERSHCQQINLCPEPQELSSFNIYELLGVRSICTIAKAMFHALREIQSSVEELAPFTPPTSIILIILLPLPSIRREIRCLIIKMLYLNTLRVVPLMVNLDTLEKLEQYANRPISIDQAVDGIKAIMGADYIHEDWMQLTAYLLDDVTVVTQFAEVKDQFLQLLVAQPGGTNKCTRSPHPASSSSTTGRAQGVKHHRTSISKFFDIDASEDDVDEEELQEEEEVGQTLIRTIQPPTADIINNYEQGHSSPLQSSGVLRGVLDLKDVVPQAVYVVKFLSAGARAFIVESLRVKGFGIYSWPWLPNRIYVEATSPKHILDNIPPSHIDATRHITLVPPEERATIPVLRDISGPCWVLIKRGKYKGDMNEPPSSRPGTPRTPTPQALKPSAATPCSVS